MMGYLIARVELGVASSGIFHAIFAQPRSQGNANEPQTSILASRLLARGVRALPVSARGTCSCRGHGHNLRSVSSGFLFRSSTARHRTRFTPANRLTLVLSAPFNHCDNSNNRVGCKEIDSRLCGVARKRPANSDAPDNATDRRYGRDFCVDPLRWCPPSLRSVVFISSGTINSKIRVAQ